MVSSHAIIFMSISLLVIITFPLGLAVYLYRKEKIALKAILVGVLVFIVFQLLTRLPILSALGNQPWFRELSASSLLFSALLVGGLSAGLFEETGRYLGFRYFLKDKLSWQNGIAFGIGHGGIEAIVLVGLAYINNIVFSIMINQGLFDSAIAPQLGTEMAAFVKSQLISTPPATFLLGGLERLLTIIIHIALSLLVLYAVISKKLAYLVYAILLHTMLNALAVIIAREFGIWYAQLYIFALAATAAFYIGRSRRFFERLTGG
ncbi:MAG TPA: YhfC family intramembrane metalloprotease [Firmicutes bacterium]|nr:YhfC family intramembrane metalloprotease [Bacillota bacterium]